MIRLLIYEDNEKLRKSLSLLFSSAGDIEMTEALPNCQEAEDDIERHLPDVVLMDIDMPGTDGIEGVKRVKEVMPDIRVIMHTVFDDDDKIFNSLAAGADGYILKNCTPVQLCNAITDVTNGGSPMSPGVARKVLESFRTKDKPVGDAINLSEREKEILTMVTQGYTYKRISAECRISIDTTRTHIKNIYAKLHVNCGPEAVAKAMKLRLL